MAADVPLQLASPKPCKSIAWIGSLCWFFLKLRLTQAASRSMNSSVLLNRQVILHQTLFYCHTRHDRSFCLGLWLMMLIQEDHKLQPGCSEPFALWSLLIWGEMSRLGFLLQFQVIPRSLVSPLSTSSCCLAKLTSCVSSMGSESSNVGSFKCHSCKWKSRLKNLYRGRHKISEFLTGCPSQRYVIHILTPLYFINFRWIVGFITTYMVFKCSPH